MDMGRRLALAGYAVLVNPFYRSATAPVVAEGASFSDPEVRGRVFGLAGELNAETHFTDARAFVEYLDRHDPEAKDTLRDSFDSAGLSAEIEAYTGAQHGWCVPDSAAYHEDQAERAWGRLLELFGRALA